MNIFKNDRLFEAIHMKEASSAQIARVITNELNRYFRDSSIPPANVINKIRQCLGQATFSGTQGFINDLGDKYKNFDTINGVLAAAADNSTNPKRAFEFYKKYEKNFPTSVDLAIIEKAIKDATNSRSLSLADAQKLYTQKSAR